MTESDHEQAARRGADLLDKIYVDWLDFVHPNVVSVNWSILDSIGAHEVNRFSGVASGYERVMHYIASLDENPMRPFKTWGDFSDHYGFLADMWNGELKRAWAKVITERQADIR